MEEKREKRCTGNLNTRHSWTIKCPSIFHAVCNTVTLKKKRVEHPPNLSHLPLGAHHGHCERDEPDAKTPHSSYSEHCHAYVKCIFLLVKTDEVQFILPSAVIPMPGACVFPTTTSRSSAAAGDGSGRCSRLPGHGGNLKENHDYKLFSGTRGSPWFLCTPV